MSFNKIKKNFKTDFKIFINNLIKSDLSVELPFTLTHPKPEPIVEQIKEDSSKLEPIKVEENNKKSSEKSSEDQAVPVDHNLIEFDTR